MSLLSAIFLVILTVTPVILVALLVKIMRNLLEVVVDLQETVLDLQCAVPTHHATKLERLFDYAEKLEGTKCNPFYTREIDFERLEMETGIRSDDFFPVSIAKIVEEWHEMKQAQQQSKE